MRLNCLILGLLCLIGCDRSPREPILVIDSDTLSLGDVKADEPKEARVQLLNHGTAPLHIKELISSCKCSGAEVSTSTIEAGSEGWLTIKVKPRDSGANSAVVTVNSDSSIEPSQTVRVSWNCVAPVELVNSSWECGSVRPGEIVARDVLVRTRKSLFLPGEECFVSKVDVSGAEGVFTSALPLHLDRDGEMILGRLTVTAPNNPGNGFLRVMFHLTGSENRELPLAVNWRVVRSFEVVPERLSLGVQPRSASDATPAGHVIVRSNQGELKCDRVTSSVDWAEADLKSQSDHSFVVSVRRTKELDAGIHTGQLELTLSSPEVTKVEIPFSVMVEESP